MLPINTLSSAAVINASQIYDQPRTSSVPHHLAVLAHFGRAPVDPVRCPHDRLIAAEIAGSRHDLVAAPSKLALHGRIEAGFHLHLADALRRLTGRLGATQMPPARRVARFLHIHAEV